MRNSTVLKVAPQAPFYKESFPISEVFKNSESHSLHYISSYPDSNKADFASYFINRYSEKGDIVFDPFCGSGTTALETALAGRIPYASDICPYGLVLTEAKLQPADITEITLRTQVMNLSSPIDTQLYNEYFSNFYDLNTFREIINLKRDCSKDSDRITRFIESLVLGLLHGPSAGFFSVPTHQKVALSPVEQKKLNIQKRQIPDYRSVVPRIIRRSASVSRDGIPSCLVNMGSKRYISMSDSRELSHLHQNSVDLIYTAPPLISSGDFSKDLWLENWYLNIKSSSYSDKTYDFNKSNYQDFINQSLLELARILKTSQRAIFFLDNDSEKVFTKTIKEDLNRFFDLEGLLVNDEKKNAIKKTSNSSKRDRHLIIRRK